MKTTEYKGHLLLVLVEPKVSASGATFGGFQFGMTKAQAIIENIDVIREFVRVHAPVVAPSVVKATAKVGKGKAPITVAPVAVAGSNNIASQLVALQAQLSALVAPKVAPAKPLKNAQVAAVKSAQIAA